MKKLLFIIIIVTIFSCKNNEQKITNLKFSENILNYNNSPKSAFDKNGLMFFDQGAWFGFSFPDTLSNYGGFSGPFLLTEQNGIWSSSSLAQLQLKNIKWDSIKTTSFSSHLEQVFTSTDVELKQQLVYASGNSAIVKSTITNTSSTEIDLEYYWKNKKLLAEELTISSNNNEVIINSPNSKAIGHLIFPETTKISSSSKTYATDSNRFTLKPNESKEIIISLSFIFPEYSWEEEQKKLSNINVNQLLELRKSEKEKELSQLFKNKKEAYSAWKYDEVLAKSHLTLQLNWRIPAGEIGYAGLFPSYHYKWFNGFWAWDSWKHAVGLSYFNTTLAKKQIKLMFDFQLEDGFIVDCVFRDTLIEKHNYRDTKPPLSAWAVSKIYKKDKDVEFIKELYPKLKKYHNWWYQKRDHDQDGLCEYGSTDGSLIAAKWESGMDNAIRFDNSKILKNEEGAFSLDQESVDLNAYLYAEKLFLATLAEALQKNEDANIFKKEADELKTKIQTQFYDTEDGWFYDTTIDGNSFIKGEGSEGWTPLWANAASQSQAEAVKNQLMNPKKFFTKVPFQTMSADHPKFNPLKGYWRGPNWLDQAHFGVKGLQNYGFHKEATKATIQIIEGAEGVLGKGTSIRENYHPISGEGLNAQNFSWSAAHLIMLLMEH